MTNFKQLIPLAVSLLTVCAAHGQSFSEAIRNCPDFQYEPYKVSPYISAAIQLQSMGQDSAVSVLRSCCGIDGNENKVIILCRMLFESDGEMRRPLMGGAVFPGNTTYDDWPAEPIEIVQNIPFLIVRGYMLGGLPEQAIDYLEYCTLQCTWRDEVYSMPSESELLTSLNKMLDSDKWQTPLTADETQFFQDQTDIQ